jgi:hypothetical protein
MRLKNLTQRPNDPKMQGRNGTKKFIRNPGEEEARRISWIPPFLASSLPGLLINQFRAFALISASTLGVMN